MAVAMAITVAGGSFEALRMWNEPIVSHTHRSLRLNVFVARGCEYGVGRLGYVRSHRYHFDCKLDGRFIYCAVHRQNVFLRLFACLCAHYSDRFVFSVAECRCYIFGLTRGDRTKWHEETPNKYRQIKEHKNAAASTLIAIQNECWVRFSHVNALTVTSIDNIVPSRLLRTRKCHTKSHDARHSNATTHSDSIYSLRVFFFTFTSLLLSFSLNLDRISLGVLPVNLGRVSLMFPKRYDFPKKKLRIMTQRAHRSVQFCWMTVRMRQQWKLSQHPKWIDTVLCESNLHPPQRARIFDRIKRQSRYRFYFLLTFARIKSSRSMKKRTESRAKRPGYSRNMAQRKWNEQMPIDCVNCSPCIFMTATTYSLVLDC